jgi:beta-lactamase regulating signal transducer with metallopeptidase domain
MIAAAMLYFLAVGVAISILAWAVEQLIARQGLARRFVWGGALVASLIVPAALMWGSPTLSTMEAEQSATAITEPIFSNDGFAAVPIRSERHSMDRVALVWPSWPELDSSLAWGWAALSSGLMLWLIAASWAVSRKLRHWQVGTLDGHIVRITRDTGPAVCGVLVPRIVVPQWVVGATNPVRELILLHEQSHLRANDPLLYRTGLLLVVLLPWNIPLWWQLHRLRFAIEVDCDARVLNAAGRDPVAYGEVLLTIGQRFSNLPIGSMALNESANQLERRIRIMMIGKPRTSALVAGALALLAGGVIACAATLNAPPLVTDKTSAIQVASDLLIPPPPIPELSRIEQQSASAIVALQSLVLNKYPQLWKGDFSGLPVVTVLFAPDGTVEKSSYEMTDGDPMVRSYSANSLERLGIATERVGYVQGGTLPALPNGKEIFARYGERANPTHDYVYFTSLLDPITPEARKSLERKLLARYFPTVVKDRVTQGQLWVILDSAGKVLATGQELVRPMPNTEGFSSSDVDTALQKQYPTLRGFIHSARFVVLSLDSPDMIKDVNGNIATLSYHWLAPGASLPAPADGSS